MSLPPEVVAADKALRRFMRAERRRQEWESALTDEDLAEIEELRAAEGRAQVALRERERRKLCAENLLDEWTAAVKARDEIVRFATESGVSVHRIYRITGIARTTIMRILT